MERIAISSEDPTSRRFGAIVAALCLVLAATGCEGPPSGAEDIVKDLAALEIMSNPPPKGVWVGSAEDLGREGMVQFDPPYVMVVYATSATVAEVDEYYISTFPAYGLDAPLYYGGSGPVPGPAPSAANLYVVVKAWWTPPTGT